jgi:hypothetical protein
LALKGDKVQILRRCCHFRISAVLEDTPGAVKCKAFGVRVANQRFAAYFVRLVSPRPCGVCFGCGFCNLKVDDLLERDGIAQDRHVSERKTPSGVKRIGNHAR